MGKKLIITEKPSVGRDYAQVLKVNNRHDGYFENEEPSKFYEGQELHLNYPKKNDYVFDGWYLDQDFTIRVRDLDEYKEDVTLYAKWKVLLKKAF